MARHGALRIHLGPPFRELRQQIGVIEEPSLLKERAFDPADQVFDGPFLPRAGGPADFDPEPEIERHARKQRIPFGDLSVRVPLQRDRLRPIEHRQERNPTDGGEVIDGVRTSVSVCSSGTIVTSTQREYLSRDAK